MESRILFAMGAYLKLVARFPEGEILINQFDEIRREAASRDKIADP